MDTFDIKEGVQSLKNALKNIRMDESVTSSNNDTSSIQSENQDPNPATVRNTESEDTAEYLPSYVTFNYEPQENCVFHDKENNIQKNHRKEILRKEVKALKFENKKLKRQINDQKIVPPLKSLAITLRNGKNKKQKQCKHCVKLLAQGSSTNRCRRHKQY